MSIPKLERDPKSGIYYVHWIEGRRSKRKSTGTKDADVAKRYLATLLTELTSFDAETPAVVESLTCGQIWDLYKESHVDTEVASVATADYCWKNLQQHFARIRPRDIDQKLVEAYRKKRQAGLIGRKSKDSTVRRELIALLASVNWAADKKRKLLPVDDVPAFDLPDDGPARDVWLRPEEIERIFAAAERLRLGTGETQQGARHRNARKPGAANKERLSRLERFVCLAWFTAAREAALCELTWPQVDFEVDVIRLNPLGRDQTKKKRATVPIAGRLREVLLRAYAERENEYVLDHTGKVWSALQRAVEEAGLANRPVDPTRTGRLKKPLATGVSPHTFRHSAATAMIRRGVSIFIVAKMLGNSVAMVEKVYGHHAPEDLRDAVEIMSADLRKKTAA